MTIERADHVFGCIMAFALGGGLSACVLGFLITEDYRAQRNEERAEHRQDMITASRARCPSDGAEERAAEVVANVRKHVAGLLETLPSPKVKP